MESLVPATGTNPPRDGARELGGWCRYGHKTINSKKAEVPATGTNPPRDGARTDPTFGFPQIPRLVFHRSPVAVKWAIQEAIGN